MIGLIITLLALFPTPLAVLLILAALAEADDADSPEYDPWKD